MYWPTADLFIYSYTNNLNMQTQFDTAYIYIHIIVDTFIIK